MTPCILWISDSPHLPTGYGRVSREILWRLGCRDTFAIYALALGADETTVGEEDWPFTLLPHPEVLPRKDVVRKTIERLCPQVVVTLCDLWSSTYLLDIARSWRLQWIGYFPVDAGPLPSYFAPILEHMEYRVTTSDYSARVIRQAFPHLDVQVIKHGVDCSVFRPGPPTLGRPQLSDGRPGFVIGCVARNQPRKGLPILIEAFARFAEQHEDALLHLHTNPWDGQGWTLGELLARHHIQDRTSFSQTMLEFGRLPDLVLSDVYRTFDIMAIPTMGEGFGLPILEAMACGIPVVATETSAVCELLDGRGELVPVLTTICVPPHGCRFDLVDTEGMLEALERLYRHPELRTQYARKGEEFARTLSWDGAAEQWAVLLDRATKRKGNHRSDRLPLPLGLSIVVLMSEKELWARWKNKQSQQLVEKLSGGANQDTVEWILVFDEEQESFLIGLKAVFGPQAILIRLAPDLSSEERLQIGVSAASAPTIWVVSTRVTSVKMQVMTDRDIQIVPAPPAG